MSIRFEKGNFAVVPNIQQIMELSEGGLKVYLAICKHADDEGGCFPSNTTLAKTTGLSESGTRKAMYEIRDRGLVEVTKRKRPNGSTASNYYQLLIVGVPTRTGEGTPPGHPLTIPIEHTIVSDDGYGSDSSNSLDLVDEAHDAPPVVETTTRKLYYDVVKMYQLVVNNHNHMTKWAKDLEASLGYDLAVLYLTRLLERDLRKERETEEFVPTLTKPMDICVKAPKIIEYFKRTKKAVLTDRRSYE